MNWINALIIPVIIAIIYQDFKYRAIDWYLFGLLPLAIIIMNIGMIKTVLFHFLINCGFLALNASFIWLFYSFKHKQLFNPLDRYIGVGDLLFYISLAMFFSPLNFMVFFTISLFITLLTYLTLAGITRITRQIPLAGFVGIMLLILVLYKNISNLNFHEDNWIMQYLIFNETN